MSGVLRGFSAGLSRISGATHLMYASGETPARLRERSDDAGGLVRLAEHINIKNQGVKSRPLAGLIEKIAHFQIETNSCHPFKQYYFRMSTNYRVLVPTFASKPP